MNATTSLPSSTAMTTSRLLGAYLQEMRCECLRYLRMPGFLLPTLLFPAVFYVMFGVLLGSKSGPDAARYLLASYTTFGVMAPGLFGFGVSLAMERDGGLLTLKRALPMPPSAYLIGKMVMAMLVATIIVSVLLVLALTLAHVTLDGQQIVSLFVTGVFGVLPFCALGLYIGTLAKGQGAPGVINLIYLPMAFLSGLWVPLKLLPAAVQNLAPVFPSYHLNRIALTATGFDPGGVAVSVAVLAAMTAGFVLLAARRLRRQG